MPKGGAKIEERILFGKYRLCRKLGAGRSGTVYLAFHTELEAYRAVKVVPKTMADYETFRKEALFLKTLRHPGIPLVYDVEEDQNNSYLIEEYLEGESLYALVKRLGSLSVKTAAEIGIQLCRIIHFMNTAENPILYLDLQPRNLLVCDGIVRLIDFDHAQYAEDVTDAGKRYGTIGFAAPEQCRGEALDCRADVYAIGALMQFMTAGFSYDKDGKNKIKGENDEFRRILQGCMESEREERYENAGEVERALSGLMTGVLKDQAIKSLTIVIAGAQSGIGTTHTAFGIQKFLTRSGCQALYQEEYDTDAVRTLAKSRNIRADHNGVFHIGTLSIRPYYGSAVKLPYQYFPVIIKDIGASWKEDSALPDADFFVLVCGGKWWETGETLSAVRVFAKHGKVILLMNHMSGGPRLRLPEDVSGLPCLYLPFFANPFQTSKDADACFRELLEIGTGGNKAWKKGKRSGRLLFKRPK